MIRCGAWPAGSLFSSLTALAKVSLVVTPEPSSSDN